MTFFPITTLHPLQFPAFLQHFSAVSAKALIFSAQPNGGLPSQRGGIRMEFIRANQLDIMLFMSGICGILFVLTVMTKNLSPGRKRILSSLEASSVLLLISDRFAYLYRGNPSPQGFWMVRISNFLVFMLTLVIAHTVTLYLENLFTTEGKMDAPPKRLKACRGLFLVGATLIVVSQFTGIYYTFDEQNVYHRASGHFVCYVIPLLIIMLQLSAMIEFHKALRPMVVYPLIAVTTVPVVASIIQAYVYGISLTNMAMVGMGIIAFVLALIDLNDAVDQARTRELELLKKEERIERTRFEQTAKALASAIDAKDKYTHGHSNRVAEYSRKIAKIAGKTEKECEQIYFAGLLHDVGKIGVPDRIITKEGKLTDEEYEQIKLHPVYGHQILSIIQQSPFLSIGARHHHERYDGRGYPDGLSGKDIPEIARIIAVADAYDAMTSSRSYRAPLPQRKVREELAAGMGTQFDPEFAVIMLRLIDQDTSYQMQEHREERSAAVSNP
jgi:HD-GYP domain-containing protein (c-di-GMP phosphodiesterase class II)